MNFEHVLGARSAMELVDVLSDDGHVSPLFAQSFLTLGDGQVSRVRVFGEHDLPSEVIKLPNSRGVSGEGFWSCKIL